MQMPSPEATRVVVFACGAMAALGGLLAALVDESGRQPFRDLRDACLVFLGLSLYKSLKLPALLIVAAIGMVWWLTERLFGWFLRGSAQRTEQAWRDVAGELSFTLSRHDNFNVKTTTLSGVLEGYDVVVVEDRPVVSNAPATGHIAIGGKGKIPERLWLARRSDGPRNLETARLSTTGDGVFDRQFGIVSLEREAEAEALAVLSSGTRELLWYYPDRFSECRDGIVRGANPGPRVAVRRVRYLLEIAKRLSIAPEDVPLRLLENSRIDPVRAVRSRCRALSRPLAGPYR